MQLVEKFFFNDVPLHVAVIKSIFPRLLTIYYLTGHIYYFA